MREVGYSRGELLEFGRAINAQAVAHHGSVASMWLARELLKTRDRQGQSHSLEANQTQVQFERERGRQNIVVKARQMGMTTWAVSYTHLDVYKRQPQAMF